MKVDWAALGEVAAVSFAAAFVVVALVSVALVGFSARAGAQGTLSTPSGERPALGPGAGTAVGVVCVGAAVLIVLYGLSTIAL